MTKKLQIMDTTLRDGEQTSGVAFKTDEKLLIAKALLLDVNVDAIEAASARVSEGEFLAVKEICKWAKSRDLLEKIEVLGFVDNHESVEWLNKAGCRVLNLLCKGSLNHLTKQIRKKPEEHIEEINKEIEYAKKLGITTNIYLEDVSHGMIDSKDYVFFLLNNIKGENRIMLPDTLGIWNPEQTYNYCGELIKKYKDKKFDFHGHNDYELAVANTLAAANAGIERVHTTVNGLGERTGNASLASVAAAINDHTHLSTNIIEKNLNKISKLVESLSGVRIAPNKPIVGEDAYTQTCGVHADGDKKGKLYFNKILPERFGGQRSYALGKTSGKANIQKNLEMLGIELDEEAKKKVLKRVVELGDKKEKITISDLPYIVSDVLETPIEEKVKLKDFVLVLDSKKEPQAKVILEIDGKGYEESAKGDGQYDAFMNAIRLIYKKIGGKLPKLKDYNVCIPPGGKTDALVETVITWEDEKSFKTIGVDSDQATSAIKATLNMLNKANSP
ncbi:MAG: 2-isopropylmalate synthase [Nanoarchaeota archaeon]|nr:2-isopropylmalate synthase [Nanoarchaeota archaeon]